MHLDGPLRYGAGPGRQEDRRQGGPDGPQAVDGQFCKNLSHWAVVLILRDGFKIDCIYTDENNLTKRIFAVLDGY